MEPVQRDLFDPSPPSQEGQSVTKPEEPFEPDMLSDLEVIEGIPGANLTKAKALCEQVVSRGLADTAVPALGKLWDRFRGFGINRPCREQLEVLETLARIDTKQSRIMVKRIAEERGLPSALLPQVLEAALACKVRFTPQRIAIWIHDERPIVRVLAFSLAQWVVLPVRILETGRSDPDLAVRRATLITMGKLGHIAARQGLLTLLAANPNADIVRALATIYDDEVITRLGRCAEEHGRLWPTILNELEAMDDPRARAVADRVKGQRSGRSADNAVET